MLGVFNLNNPVGWLDLKGRYKLYPTLDKVNKRLRTIQGNSINLKKPNRAHETKAPL